MAEVIDNVAVALGSENIGFALPVNLVSSIVDSVNKTGRIVRPLLGVRYVQITPVVQERNSLPVDYGVLISRGEEESDLAIIPGSAADKAGLQEGDIILEIDGVRLIEETSLASIIRKKKVGDTITLTLLRADQERVVSVSLEEAPQ
ncbi:PDZ domain-containing protein [Patescibacteria group bacterium]|nr:PDZ domain-containing protein [Patescibacteria group bacterium]